MDRILKCLNLKMHIKVKRKRYKTLVIRISLYIEAEHFDEAVKQLTQAGGQPISEPHVNTKYEDTEGNQTVYVKSPWGSLIELQTVPNGFYYPYDSEAEVFVPKKVDN